MDTHQIKQTLEAMALIKGHGPFAQHGAALKCKTCGRCVWIYSLDEIVTRTAVVVPCSDIYLDAHLVTHDMHEALEAIVDALRTK